MTEVETTIGSGVHTEMQRGPPDYGDVLLRYIQWEQSIFWLSFQARYKIIFLYTSHCLGFGCSGSAFWRGRLCSSCHQTAKEGLLTSVQKVCQWNICRRKPNGPEQILWKKRGWSPLQQVCCKGQK